MSAPVSDRSFQQAVQLLETYTQCKASFQDLRWAYTSVRRSRAAEQRILQEAWATAEPTLGLIAAQISDTQLLAELATNDARQLLDSLVRDSQGHESQLCQGSEAFLDAAQEGLANGFFGQTVKQLGTAFVEMAHLHQRLGRFRRDALEGVESFERWFTNCATRYAESACSTTHSRFTTNSVGQIVCRRRNKLFAETVATAIVDSSCGNTNHLTRLQQTYVVLSLVSTTAVVAGVLPVDRSCSRKTLPNGDP